MPYPRLFSPFVLGGLTLKNRIVMAPMSSSLADDEGRVTPELVAYVRERARGGTGLIIVEFACVDARYGRGEIRQLRIDREADVAGHAALVCAIREAGAAVFLQLHLPGQYIVPGTLEGALPVAPSDVFARRTGQRIARALRGDEITGLVGAFARGATRAVAAGYQGIELHGAHGYLLMAFLSPLKNMRDDEWGGDFERRLRFPLEAVRATRAALGPGRPLVYRISAAEFREAGLGIEDMERIVPRLVEAGVDAIHVSSGTIEGAMDKIVEPMSQPEGWRFDLSGRIRRAAGVPVIAVGPVRWPAAAERALAENVADLIALGRPLLADPHWTRKAEAGEEDGITPCTNCNWCMERVRRHESIGCAENPRTGHEAEPALDPRSAAGRAAAVVGAGPGGLVAALELARAGYRTHLFEARDRVGGGLIASAAPPFKERLEWYRQYLARTLERSAVQVHLGVHASAADLLALHPALVIIASGSRPRAPDVEALAGADIHDAHDVLMGDILDLPLDEGPIAVYGGGETGCETAEYLAARGATVLLVTRSAGSDLARKAEPLYRHALKARLAANPRITLIERSTVVAFERGRLTLRDGEGSSTCHNARALLIAQGRDSNRALAVELSEAGVACAVVGDAAVVGRIGDAVHQAYEAVRRLHRMTAVQDS